MHHLDENAVGGFERPDTAQGVVADVRNFLGQRGRVNFIGRVGYDAVIGGCHVPSSYGGKVEYPQSVSAVGIPSYAFLGRMLVVAYRVLPPSVRRLQKERASVIVLQFEGQMRL